MNCLGCGRRLYPRRCAVSARNRHGGRGLCVPCYEAKRNAGELDQFPRRTRRSADTVEDAEFLASTGLTRPQVARRLGMTENAIYQARKRVTQAHARSRA